jgi:hypothetical protein
MPLCAIEIQSDSAHRGCLPGTAVPAIRAPEAGVETGPGYAILWWNVYTTNASRSVISSLEKIDVR